MSGIGIAFDVRQVRHEIVERLKLHWHASFRTCSIRSFRFAGKEGDPHPFARRTSGRYRRACSCARNMKSAHAHLDAAFSQRFRQIEGVRETDSTAHRSASPCPHQPPRSCPASRSGRMRVFVSSNGWISIATSSPRTWRCGAIAGQAINRRQRIRGYGRTKPLNHIAVIVVMRWLDENETKAPSRASRCGQGRHHGFLNRAIIHYLAAPDGSPKLSRRASHRASERLTLNGTRCFARRRHRTPAE